jgi:hypothetical protein
MAYVNWVTYEAQLKVVYYGPGYAGKTTSLRYLSLRLETDVKELPTTDDRSVFFEYTQSQKLPANNLEVKFLYWTLPANRNIEELGIWSWLGRMRSSLWQIANTKRHREISKC